MVERQPAIKLVHVAAHLRGCDCKLEVPVYESAVEGASSRSLPTFI